LANVLYLRVDVDGYYGLRLGVRNLLDLFGEYGVRATFFVNMGREPFYLKYISKLKKSSKSKRSFGRHSWWQKLRMLLLPKGIGIANFNLLREIEKRGHEVEPHAWNHADWNLKLEEIDQKRELEFMSTTYEKCFGRKPTGFAPPSFKFNRETLSILQEMGFEYVSLMGKSPEWLNGIWNFPVTYPRTIEEEILMGGPMSLSRIKEHIEASEYASIYIHADWEGIRGIRLLESLLTMVKTDFGTYKELLNSLR